MPPSYCPVCILPSGCGGLCWGGNGAPPREGTVMSEADFSNRTGFGRLLLKYVGKLPFHAFPESQGDTPCVLSRLLPLAVRDSDPDSGLGKQHVVSLARATVQSSLFLFLLIPLSSKHLNRTRFFGYISKTCNYYFTPFSGKSKFRSRLQIEHGDLPLLR